MNRACAASRTFAIRASTAMAASTIACRAALRTSPVRDCSVSMSATGRPDATQAPRSSLSFAARRHTSFASLYVWPELGDDVDVEIEEKDLRVDTYRSSGAGGQHVNVTDSAIRITHLPTGIVVSCQNERSQHKNRAQAMKVLCAKLYEIEREQQDSARAATRRSQVGTGDRSERIRTYNYPQGRVTDHRINLTLHKLDRIINGEELDEIVDALISEDRAARLAELQ